MFFLLQIYNIRNILNQTNATVSRKVPVVEMFPIQYTWHFEVQYFTTQLIKISSICKLQHQEIKTKALQKMTNFFSDSLNQY